MLRGNFTDSPYFVNDTLDSMATPRLFNNVTFNVTDLEFPHYIQTITTLVIAILLALGTVGNILVPLVVCKTKDLRNSTNLFLINLSVSDLLVLLFCMPTALIELHSQPEVWNLGEGMCRLIPFLELAVAHVSILTILAISFERYYAICKPLKAGYTCTKMRAFAIIGSIWVVAVLVTSPMFVISEYQYVQYIDGSIVPSCGTSYGREWQRMYILSTIALLFALPFFILVAVYTCIAQHLMIHGRALSCSSSEQAQIRARRQVVMMLVAVVLSFFLCLLPYRVLIVWIIVSPSGVTKDMTMEVYYNLLYFCRVMLYINSAINPILYNVISSKFRDAFCKLLGCRRHRLSRQSTNTQTSTSLTFQSSLKSRSSMSNGVFNSVVSVGGSATPPTAKSV